MAPQEVRGLQLVAADLEQSVSGGGAFCLPGTRAGRTAGRPGISSANEEHYMARNITAHTRYRLAAVAFAAAGGLWCLGAMFGHHTMTLLVIGMMNLAAST